MVRALGVGHVIDYTREDFTQKGQNYDVIFDAVTKRTFADCKRALRNQGTYITPEFSPAIVLQGQWVSMTSNQKMVPLPPKPPKKQDQVFIKELLEAGKVSPVMDRTFTLSDPPGALRYLEKDHARGKVVVIVDRNNI